jgi:hypothetical protein
LGEGQDFGHEVRNINAEMGIKRAARCKNKGNDNMHIYIND